MSRCERCGSEVEEFRGKVWSGTDFMCPDGEEEHRIRQIPEDRQ